MPSQLSRRVFRCLIANEYLYHPGCVRHFCKSTASQWQQHGSRRSRIQARDRLMSGRQQHRTLFSFPSFSQPSQREGEQSFDPGIERMMELERMQRLKARLPSIADMVLAMRAFLAATRGGMPDTQARLLHNTLLYIGGSLAQDEGDAAKETGLAVSREQYAKLCKAVAQQLFRQKNEVGNAHVELASLLYSTCAGSADLATKLNVTHSMVRMLCLAGQHSKARDVLMESSYLDESTLGIDPEAPRDGDKARVSEANAAWVRVLSSYAVHGSEPELLETLELWRSHRFYDDLRATRIMLRYYADHDNIEQTKTLFSKWHQPPAQSNALLRTTSSSETNATTLRVVLSCCLRSGQQDLGQDFVREILQANPPKALWDEILVWAYQMHKSVDEIDRMLEVMASSKSKGMDRRLPDVSTINRLVQAAIAENDPYAAERLITLGKDRDIQPDAETLVLQIQYRLSVNDVDGALVAYKHLQSKDLSSQNDVPAVNQLLVALCSSTRHDFDTVMNVAADLSDRRAPFDAKTVQSLAILHLRRDELQDVQDLIRTHAHRFQLAERTSLKQTILDFCLDSKTPVATMWDGYQILREDFDEMPREDRVKVMQSCFDRKRPDMAVHVFNHMRRHSRADTMPTAETYMAAFLAAGKHGDVESLEVLNNQLRLDVNVDVDTRMRNALMMAYTACRMGRRAVTIWEDIVDTREGPTRNSICLALNACAITSFGDLKARDIWARLRRNNVELDQGMWASYITALAGNGDIHAAIEALQAGVQAEEVDLDTQVLGSLYNIALLANKLEDLEFWAQDQHADAWQRLETAEKETNKFGVSFIKVSTDVDP